MFPYRHFIGLLSGGFLVIIAKKGSSKVPQGPSPPLLLTVVVDFVTLLTCCNKSLFVILIHCVTVARVTTPTKAKKNKQELFSGVSAPHQWDQSLGKIETKRNEMRVASLFLPFFFFFSQNRHIMLVNYSC